MNSIQYTYLLLDRDKTRAQFVKDIISVHTNIDVDLALDADNFDDIHYIYNLLDQYNISIDKKRDPRKLQQSHKKRILTAKLAVYGSYLKVLEKYKDCDFLVILQDDAFFVKSFFNDIEYLISQKYIPNQGSCRLGQYLSGAMFSKNFIDLLIDNLKKTKIVLPFDHYLAGVDGYNKLMKPFYKEIVYTKNFKSNIE